MSPELLVLVAALLLAALVAWLALAVRRAWKAWLLNRRMRRAASGEVLAERWLAARGHRILQRQLTRRSTMLVDGLTVAFDVRADLLVQMGDERVLVEVKTGDAADPRSTATRRQLLEYATVFGVGRLYLFDATRQTLHEVEFPNSIPAAGQRS